MLRSFVPVSRCPTRPSRHGVRTRLHCALVLTVLLGVGCERTRAPAPEPSGTELLLTGDFRTIAKTASGRARLEREGAAYRLVLDGVKVDAPPPVRVYLVGVADAADTAAVDGAELKYDLGPLETGAAQQSLALPSAPDPKLRSVVLWNPRYGANLATATLHE